MHQPSPIPFEVCAPENCCGGPILFKTFRDELNILGLFREERCSSRQICFQSSVLEMLEYTLSLTPF